MIDVRRGGLALLAVTIASCGAKPDGQAQPERPVPVRVAYVRAMAFAPTLELSGNVGAARQVVVGAAVSGRVVETFVRTGEEVGAGQPVAAIDDSAYRADYGKAVDSVGSAEAGVAQTQALAQAARSRLELAQATAKRMALLYDEGAISHQDADQARADLAAARAGVEQALAAIAAAAASRAEAQASVAAAGVPLGDSVVRAPFEGIVLAREVEPGAVVGVGSPIVTIEDKAHLELDVTVPDAAARAVHPRMPVTARVDALGGQEIPGAVRAVLPSGTPGVRSVIAKIDLQPAHGLYPGMFARVRLAAPARRAAAVPASAIVTRDGQTGVFTVAGGRAEFVPVQTGATQSGCVELVAGVLGGKPVATSALEKITSGTAVSIER